MTPAAAARVIRITAGFVLATARLDGSRTATALWDALPIEAKAETWGDEIRPASPVNVLGRVDGDATVFRKLRAGTRVRIERAS
jgi:hypothetical protein